MDRAAPRTPPGVAFVLNALAAAGAEKQVLLTARALAEAGVAVRVYTLRRERGYGRFPDLVERASTAGVEFFRPARDAVPWIVASLHDCRAWIEARPARVVWTWGTRADALVAVCLPRAVRVSSLRSASADRVRRRSHWWRLLDRGCARYVSNSHRGVELLDAILPGVATRCRVLYNALDDAARAEPPVDLPASRPAVLDIVMLGNVGVRAKGYDVAVDAVRLARAEGLPVRLRIAGQPWERRCLERLIARAGIASAIEYVGPVSDPYAYLRSGHMFLLTSRYEGCPNALLEAMALGLPCIATAVGDLGRLAAEGAPIRLVPIENPDAVLQEMREAVRDWPGFRRLGAGGREWVRARFTPDAFRTGLFASLDGVLARGLTAGVS